MMRRPDLVRAFERSLQQQPVDVAENLRIMQAFYEQACTMGVLPLEDPLAGVEVDVRLAAAFRHLEAVQQQKD